MLPPEIAVIPYAEEICAELDVLLVMVRRNISSVLVTSLCSTWMPAVGA